MFFITFTIFLRESTSFPLGNRNKKIKKSQFLKKGLSFVYYQITFLFSPLELSVYIAEMNHQQEGF
jgi:hypothetical protein